MSLSTLSFILCNDLTLDDKSRNPSKAAQSSHRRTDFEVIGATFDFVTNKVDRRSPLFHETRKTQAA